MKKSHQYTLLASVLVILGASRAFADPRARPGFSSDGISEMHEVLIPSSGGREPIDDANRPSRLHPDLRGALMRLGAGPNSGESSRPIFPSSWWPMSENGIASRWAANTTNYEDRTSNTDNLSPAEKYDLLFYPNQTQRLPEVRSYTSEELRGNRRGPGILRPSVVVAGPTTAWELQNHGTYQSTVPESWWGHCNGWSSYVTAERDGAPSRDIRVRRDGDKVTECRENGPGCILFRTADIEALLTEVYFHDAATVSGRRCNTPESKIARDINGRPVDPACRDLNPGSLHVALVGLLGQGAVSLATPGGQPENLPFVIDFAYHEEVWTFPVVKYEIRGMEEITAAQATDYVCRGSGPMSGCAVYQWNPNARRFARVRTSVFVVNYATDDAALLLPPLSRQRPLAETSLNYVLELDGRGTILGGEWIESPSQGGPNNKKLHPDFMFMAVFPAASDEGSDDRGGSGDNPYVSYPMVRALLDMSQTNGRH